MGAFLGGVNGARRLGSGAGNSAHLLRFQVSALSCCCTMHHDNGLQISGQLIQLENKFMAINFQGGLLFNWNPILINAVIARLVTFPLLRG